MTTKGLLPNDRRGVRAAFGKSDKDVDGDIEIIRNWVKSQPHLPEMPSDNMIEFFLAINKFSVERTKQKLDMYYTIRPLIPEIYDHCNLRIPQMQGDNAGVFVSLPKQTKDLYRVYITKIRGEDFDIYQFLAHMINLMEIAFHHDIAQGLLFVVDHTDLNMSHVMKMTPSAIKRLTIVLEIHLHSSLEDLYEHVPREILPIDYGGEEISVKELNELWKKCLRENSERFDKLAKMKVNEELRPAPLDNDDILGYHGNFKKLDVD
ncbi:uncharacterized protein LOC108905892 [Anoplophora glabripennis]|uniref:uncharacterized protein LOC108905892 n=1 Tax=Anoplophora glabripennis TaxID=217634 RepID=UPI000C78DBF4|nr:uncharacterized protein LOC108905892 [Anoplophora glabripennis]